MKKFALFNFLTVLFLSAAFPVNASSINTQITVSDSLFVVYEFKNLNQTIYNQALTQFNAETIPQTIIKSLKERNQTRVGVGYDSQPIVRYNDTTTLKTSFFLYGSDIISFSVNRTTMERTYQMKTDWRKFQFNLTTSFPIDFAQRLAKPVAEWQKINSTTFYYENMQEGALDMSFYLDLPASASRIQVQGDTVSYDMQPSFEEQLLNSPFLILGALAMALVIVSVFRKAR